jgi:hypothetical protein
VAAHLLVSVEVLLDGRFIQMNRLSSGWLDYLDEEDLAFIKRLVMASGSLKEVAAGYGISYPTVRLRLDRLIAKITITDSQAIQSEFERLLRTQHAEGKIDADTLKTLPGAYRLETEDKKKDRASRSA